MKAIICELCGGNDLVKDGDVFVCQHCGTKYTTEEARKLVVEANVTVSGPVSVKGIASIDNLLRRADDFEARGDLVRAAEYYDRVLDVDFDNVVARRGLARVKRAVTGVPSPSERTEANTAGPNLIVDFSRGVRGSTIGVFIDGNKAGDAWGRKTESYTLMPGHHAVGVNGGARRCRHPLDMEVREGVTYRLVAEWKGLSVKFSVSEE